MNVPATTQPKMHLMTFMADRYALREEEFTKTVRATCGLTTATAEQFAAFVIVAKEYDLNPLTREIYAFPSRGGGIVPIVSIDGWINLVNSHPSCDGFEFEAKHDEKGELFSMTCKMHRKDRKVPVTVTEYLSECIRATDPWKMKHRMLRHKSLIQAARYAFGFAGIYDEDEGRIIADSGPINTTSGASRVPSAPPAQIEHKADAPADQPQDAPPAEQQTAGEKQPMAADAVAKLIKELQGKRTVETLKAWQAANKAAVDPLPDDQYNAISDSFRAQMAKLRAKAGDPISTGPQPEQAKAAPAAPTAGMPDIEGNYSGWLEWATAQIAAATDPDVLEVFMNQMIEANREHIFPPDYTDIVAAHQAADRRLTSQ